MEYESDSLTASGAWYNKQEHLEAQLPNDFHGPWIFENFPCVTKATSLDHDYSVLKHMACFL